MYKNLRGSMAANIELALFGKYLMLERSMRVVVFNLALILLFLGNSPVHAENKSAEAQKWSDALEAIDNPEGLEGVFMEIGCMFAPGSCSRLEKIAANASRKYQRTVSRSWRRRGMRIPPSCLQLSIDGAQVARIVEGVSRAQPNLKKGYYETGHDLVGYSLMPWDKLDCQTEARKEIFRVRNLQDPIHD